MQPKNRPSQKQRSKNVIVIAERTRFLTFSTKIKFTLLFFQGCPFCVQVRRRCHILDFWLKRRGGPPWPGEGLS